MKHLLVALTILASSFAMAAEGTGALSLYVSDVNASVDATLADGKLNGNIFNFGSSFGKIELTKVKGLWQGNFGFNQIKVKNQETLRDGSVRFTFTVLPGGVHSYTFKVDKKGNYSVSGLNGDSQMVSASISADGKEFFTRNERVSTSLSQDKKDAKLFEGYTYIRRPGTFDYSVFTTLSSEGALNPLTLAQTEPILFTLLYVLPFNLK
jgi:hypothetical protein